MNRGVNRPRGLNPKLFDKFRGSGINQHFSIKAVVLFTLGLLASTPVLAEMPLDDWRGEVVRLRQQAESDAPQAYHEAQLLQKDIPSGATYADRARLLNLLSRIELHLALISRSVQHSAEAWGIAKQANDADGQIEAILNSALGAINQGRFDDMIDATQDGMTLLEKVQREELRAEMMFQAAMMYLRFGQVEELVLVAMQGLAVAQSSRDPRVRLYAAQSMATALMQSKRHEEALVHYRNMREAAQQAHYPLMEAAALLGLSSVAEGLGDMDEAMRLNKQAVSLFQRIGAPFYVSHAQHQRADMLLNRKQPEEALPLIDANVHIYETHDNPIGLWWTLQLRSHTLQTLGRLTQARRDAGRAYALAQKSGFNIYLSGSAQRLSEVIAAQGGYKEAYRWSAEAIRLKALTDRQKTGERIVQLAKRFREESKQREIDALNRENERYAELQQKLQIVLSGMMVLLGVTVFFLLRLRRSRAEISALNAGLEQRVLERTAELLESQQSLTEAQRIAQVGSWKNDLVNNVLTWSDEVYRIFEIDPQQFGASYEAFMESVHPADRGKLDRTFKAALESREPFEIEHRLLLPDGRIKYVHEHCETSYDADGRPSQSIGTVQDITGRKEMENALHKSRQLLTAAQRIAHVGGWELDHASNELTWSDECHRIFEIDLPRFGGTYEAFLDTLYPDDRDMVHRAFQASLENREPYEIEHRLSFSDGRIKYVQERCETSFDADGKPLRSIGTVQDITERKEMENAMRENRELLAEAQRIAQVGSWEYDIINDAHSWSDELFRIYELDPAEGASYDGCMTATHPDDREAISNLYLSAVETGNPYESEHRLLMPDGRIKYVHERCEMICAPNGTLIRAVGMMQDVTGRVLVEHKLKESLEFTEGIINAIPDILFEMNDEGRYLNIWTHTPELLAAQKDELLGHSVNEMLTSEAAATMMSALREAQEEGVSFGKTIAIDLPRGTSWFELSVSKKSGGTFLVLSRDVSTRKRMEAELQGARNFLGSVIDAVPDPIFVKDRQHRWILLNDANCKFTGMSREALIGKLDYDIFSKEEAAVFWEKDELVFESGEVNLNEEQFTSANGDVHHIQTKKTPFVSADGSQMLVGVIRDITERKQFEMARETALAEAVRLAKLRRDFLAHMSHELRTPLNGILGHTQLLQRGAQLDGKQAESLTVIRHSGEHLLSLIDDILDLARIDAGRFELNSGVIALEIFLRIVCDIVAVRAKSKGIGFDCELAPGLPVGVRGDEKRLRQVLLNLLSNAVKFTERGRVVLRVVRATPSSLAFEVEDSGIGINAEKIQDIFQPFGQAGEAMRHSEGTGLGLSISRQLVRLMGGEITVESRVGVGSIFRFELELSETHIGPEVLRAEHAVQQQAVEADEPPRQLLAPPPENMRELHRLALLGNMRDIVRQAEHIGALDARYRPFAENLKHLAEGFQSKAILAFVEEYLP